MLVLSFCFLSSTFVKACIPCFQLFVRSDPFTFRALTPDEIFVGIFTYSFHIKPFFTNLTKLPNHNHVPEILGLFLAHVLPDLIEMFSDFIPLIPWQTPYIQHGLLC